MLVKDRELLRRIMEAKGMSGRALSARVGFQSHSYVNRILSGVVRSVTPETATKIAFVLGVPTDLLFMPKASSASRQNVKEAS